MTFYDYHVPPMPIDPEDSRRWNETRRRRRLLDGAWPVDLERKLEIQFGLIRREVMGPSSLAKNFFKRTCEELASLYHKAPRQWHESGDSLDEFLGPNGLIQYSMRWNRMRRFQVETLGLRENMLRFDVRDGRLFQRTVYPDTVTARSHPSDPNRPIEIKELLWHAVPGLDRPSWCWHVLSIEDEANPSYRVFTSKNGGIGEDVTAVVLGGDMSGENYPYRWTQGDRAGTPFLPYVLFHAEMGAGLFDAFNWLELVEGSYDVACLWTFWVHVVFRASWPQRYALNAIVAGTATEDGDGRGRRQSIPTDPTSVVHFEVDQPGTQPQIGQFVPSADAKQLQQAIAAFEGSLVAITGIDAANIVRDSSDAFSGAALSINRDGKREAQAAYEEQFRMSDVEATEKSAALLNLSGALPYDLPESGYRIAYSTIPLSPNELQSRREHNNGMIEAGRMSRVDAYIDENPGTSRDEAMQALERIATENAIVEKLTTYEDAPDAPDAPDTDDTPEDQEVASAADQAQSAQDTALNGAQVSSLLELITAVAERRLPRQSAIAIIQRAFSVSADDADLILGDVGRSFFVDIGEEPPQ